MKKIFLELDPSKIEYVITDQAQTQNFILEDLFMFLKAWGDRTYNPLETYTGMNWEWLRLDKTADAKHVYLWNHDWNMKKQAPMEGLSQMEQDAFDRAYEDYVEKRRADVPKLHMTMKNYLEIVQKWQKIILRERPNCVIISQDDSGYVDLVGKDAFTEQDLLDIHMENQKYLKYRAAYDKYMKSIPHIFDELWHGPESEEYEADWQKFLDESLD